MRPIVYRVPQNESELEGRLRRLRQDTEDWNHDFWTRQNISFTQVDAFLLITLLILLTEVMHSMLTGKQLQFIRMTY